MRQNKRRGTVHPVLIELKRTRRIRRISQRKLAARAGYNQNTICKTETGATTPMFNIVVDMARALGYELVLRKMEDVDNNGKSSPVAKVAITTIGSPN